MNEKVTNASALRFIGLFLPFVHFQAQLQQSFASLNECFSLPFTTKFYLFQI